MINIEIGITITKQSFEGNKIENVASQLALHQIINEPTHILPNSSSCIDLIFTSQPNMVIESGIHSSLHSSCHHQIVFAKFNLKYVTHHHIQEKSGISKKRKLISLVEH